MIQTDMQCFLKEGVPYIPMSKGRGFTAHFDKLLRQPVETAKPSVKLHKRRMLTPSLASTLRRAIPLPPIKTIHEKSLSCQGFEQNGCLSGCREAERMVTLYCKEATRHG